MTFKLNYAAAFLATIIAIYSNPSAAEEYDTGWKELNKSEFQDLQITGKEVRVNNFNISIGNNLMYRDGIILEFSASAINRSSDPRYASIQVVLFGKDNGASLAFVAKPSFFQIPPAKSDEIKADFLINNESLEDISKYAVRVIIN